MGQQHSNRHRSTVFHIDGHCRSGKCDLVDNECVTDRSNCFVVARNLCCESIGEVADALSFVVEITAKGRDFFYKEHYPSMRLVEENGRYYIHGFYNVGEEEFIADYFIHYGDEVQTVESMALREVIRTRLRTLTMHYKEMA